MSLVKSQIQKFITAAYNLGLGGQWVKITKAYTDFSAAGLTNSINIYSLPAKAMIHACIVKQSTNFTGGIIATYTISVGVGSGASVAKYGLAFDVFQSAAANVIGVNVLGGVEDFSGATNITATAVSTVGLLNAATQGSVDIYLFISKLP